MPFAVTGFVPAAALIAAPPVPAQLLVALVSGPQRWKSSVPVKVSDPVTLRTAVSETVALPAVLS